MARRKEGGHGGGHGWFVTFADLMGLLVAFFVMLVAFSTQDQQKLQIVAGSMREAFGVQTETRYSGIIDVDGKPNRTKPKNVTSKPQDTSLKPRSATTCASTAPASRRTARSRWRPHRCARRWKACPSSPTFPGR